MGIISNSHDFAFSDAYLILFIDILRLVLTKINIKLSWLWDGKV